jgi:hypothetical protein
MMDPDTKFILAIAGTAIAICLVITVYVLFIMPQGAKSTGEGMPTPTPTMPSIMDVTSGVNGQSYSGQWGEMLQSYGRDISFWTEGDNNVYFGMYFDLEANSARNPADRPGLRLEGGSWSQNRNEIIVMYSSTYDFKTLIEYEKGNVTGTGYESHLILRCLDKSCHDLVGDDGVAYHFSFNNTEAIASNNASFVSPYGNVSGAL